MTGHFHTIVILLLRLQMFACKKLQHTARTCLIKKKKKITLEHCQPRGKKLLNTQEVLHFDSVRDPRDRNTRAGLIGQYRENIVICTRMSFQCETDNTACQRSTVVSTCPSVSGCNLYCACTFAHVQCLCITTRSKLSANPTVGVSTAPQRCPMK